MSTTRGRAHRFGDDVNTDVIIAAQHKTTSLDLAEMARHTFEDIDPGFVGRVQPGDVLVAGSNFGCGSSRETAAHVLRELGIGAVLAHSFARIFFRNAINIGLTVLECDTSAMRDGDEIEVDLERGIAINHSRDITTPVTPLPAVMRAVLREGGMAAYLRTHGDLVDLAEADAVPAQATGELS